MTHQRKTPGLPGVFADLQWVGSPDFGEKLGNRRNSSLYDVDPAPIARLLAVALKLVDGDLRQCMRRIAEDERDGPIHIVHLAAACEYAAMQTGGGLPRPGGPTGSPASRAIVMTVSPDALPAIVAALREDGLAAATAIARALDVHERTNILDVLLRYAIGPITGLSMDLSDEHFRPTRRTLEPR